MSEDARQFETDLTRLPSQERIDSKFGDGFNLEVETTTEPAIPVDTPQERKYVLILEQRYLLAFGEPVPTIMLDYDTEEDYVELIRNQLLQGVPFDTRASAIGVRASDKV